MRRRLCAEREEADTAMRVPRSVLVLTMLATVIVAVPLRAEPALAGGVLLDEVHLLESRAGPGDANTKAGVNHPLAPATATFQVTYVGFSAPAQAAFQRAVDIWSSHIASSVPIRITAYFKPLETGVLGSAGAEGWRRDFGGAPQMDTYYPLALSDALNGSDLDPGQPDIVANFNNLTSWYFGTDGNTPPGKYDLVTTVLHGIGHGLGLAGSMRVAGGIGSWGLGPAGGPRFPTAFDRFTETAAGTALLNTGTFPNPSASLAAALQSDSLYFDGPKANAPVVRRSLLWAPPPWHGATSYSHLHENLYPAGTINSLMTPFVRPAEANHAPGPTALCMFEDMGWQSSETCAPPPNDSFAAAQVITGPAGSVAGTNISATQEPGEPSHVPGRVGGPSIWYSWTAPSTGIYTFDTDGSISGSWRLDAVMALYTGSSVSGLTLVANDDRGIVGPLHLVGGSPTAS